MIVRALDRRGALLRPGTGLAALGLSLVMGGGTANQPAIGLPVLGFAVTFSLLVIAGDHQRGFFVVAGRAAREEAAPRLTITHCARDDLALVVERPPAPADELDLQTRAESTA